MTAAAPPQGRTSYLTGPLTDSLWIVLNPLLALLLLLGLWNWSGYSDRTIYAILFAFVVTGHHMPGWLRAFGEPVVYERFKARLWVSLLAIPALVILPTWFGLGMVALCVAAAFDLWHVAMQQHGFGRIYGAKGGDTAKGSARLDWICVLTWYATVVAWSDSWMQAIAAALRNAHLDVFALFTPASWRVVEIALLVVSLGLLLAYLATALRLWREQRRIAVQKHLVHAVAFAVLGISYQDPSWFRANAVQNFFHATQYFFMVWIFGALSMRRDSERPRAFYRVLFGSRAGLLPYAFLIGAYGFGAWFLSSSGYRIEGATEDDVRLQLIGSIGLASLLLHYYVDSFIWKVREKHVRTALAIESGDAAAETRRESMHGAIHAIAYFGIPMVLVAVLGASQGGDMKAGRAHALGREAELFPRSALAHALHGQAELDNGDVEAGRAAMERAVALAPTLEGPAKVLAAIAKDQGDQAKELEYRKLAVVAEPRSTFELHTLARLQWGRQDLDGTEQTLRRLLELAPKDATVHQDLGAVFRKRRQDEQALVFFQSAYALNPNQKESARSLAGCLGNLGRLDEAVRVLDEYLGRHPDDEVARKLRAEIDAAWR